MDYITTTPADYDISESVSYSSIKPNIGLLALTFKSGATSSGYLVATHRSLLSVIFQNLKSIPTVAVFSIVNNPALVSISAPELVSSQVTLTITGNQALTGVSFPALTSFSGVTLTNPSLKEVSFPLLTTSTGAITLSSSFPNNPSLTSVSFPVFKTGTRLDISTATALTTLKFPALTTITGLVDLSDCSALSNLSFPNYLPTNGSLLVMTGCALSQASIDHVLARAVANPLYVSGAILLPGGTNSVPGTQGQLDKAILIARGVNVQTN